jgi:hypothetical protein
MFRYHNCRSMSGLVGNTHRRRHRRHQEGSSQTNKPDYSDNKPPHSNIYPVDNIQRRDALVLLHLV